MKNNLIHNFSNLKSLSYFLLKIILIFILSSKVMSNTNGIPCRDEFNDNNLNLPIDYSTAKDDAESGIIFYKNDVESKSILKYSNNAFILKGELGRINIMHQTTFDNNLNYTCNELKILFKNYTENEYHDLTSINQFIIKCQIDQINEEKSKFNDKNIFLVFPVKLNAVSESSDNQFLSKLIDSFKNNFSDVYNENTRLSDLHQINNLSIFELVNNHKDLDRNLIYKQFKFFNGYDPEDCEDSTWIISDGAIMISQEHNNYLINLLKSPIMRDGILDKKIFNYFNDNHEKDEKISFSGLTTSPKFIDFSIINPIVDNKAKYLKVFSKIVFIVMVIFLYN